MGQRRRAREFALQMLFQIDLTGAGPREVFATFWVAHEVEEDLQRFAESLVLGVADERERMDERIASASQHWRVDRMPVVDRNVLRLAAYELVHMPDTPAAVVIDEAIEVARKYGSEESASFVNGVLDTVRHHAGREGPTA